MSARGQASKEFDNMIAVGAADGTNRAAYSSFGAGLDLLASGSTGSFTGTSRAAAEVTGAVSQVWAANPQLSYQQVKNILLQTATDLSAPGWDDQTGFGLLSLAAAVELAKAVAQELPKASESPNLALIPASDEPGVLPGERPANSYSYSYSNSGDGYSSSYSYTSNYTGDWNAGTSDYSSRSESSSNSSSSSDGYSYNSRSNSLSTSESHSDWTPSWSRYNSSSDYSNTSSSNSQCSSNGYSYTSSSSSSSSSSGDSQWEGEYSRVSSEGRSHGEGNYRSSYESSTSTESSYSDGSGYTSISSNSSDSVTQWTSSWDNNSGYRYTSTTTQTSWYYSYSLHYWALGYRWSWQLTSTSSQSGYRDGQYWSSNPVTQTLSDSGEVEFNDVFYFNEDDYFDSGSGGDDSNEGGSGDKSLDDYSPTGFDRPLFPLGFPSMYDRQLIRETQERLSKTPLTSLHASIIQTAIQTQAAQGTNEWDLGDFNQWKAGLLNINQFKNQWVCGYKNVINAAATEFNIPPRLLAAVAWREVGGDPHFLDDWGFYFRILSGNLEAAKKTSFGNVTIQVRRAAEALGYNPTQLSDGQVFQIIKSLREPRQNIFIVAKHLSYLRSRYLPGKSAGAITERELLALAGAFFAEPVYATLEDFWTPYNTKGDNYAGGYGRSAFNGLNQSGCF